MKIASWNINSLRVRLPHVLSWLTSAKPDVLALQEIKMLDGSALIDEFLQLGYTALFNGQKTYNGVAFLSRLPLEDVQFDIPTIIDPQRRIIAATCAGIRIINVYVPNGRRVDSESYHYKLDWLAKLKDFLAEELLRFPKLIILGDFNITPTDEDVHDPEEWRGQILCSELERQALADIMQLGLQDCFRLQPQPEKTFSWWDYRLYAFRRNRGLRIDLILASSALAEQFIHSTIDKTPRTLERPSDHTPVIAEFAT